VRRALGAAVANDGHMGLCPWTSTVPDKPYSHYQIGYAGHPAIQCAILPADSIQGMMTDRSRILCPRLVPVPTPPPVQPECQQIAGGMPSSSTESDRRTNNADIDFAVVVSASECCRKDIRSRWRRSSSTIHPRRPIPTRPSSGSSCRTPGRRTRAKARGLARSPPPAAVTSGI